MRKHVVSTAIGGRRANGASARRKSSPARLASRSTYQRSDASRPGARRTARRARLARRSRDRASVAARPAAPSSGGRGRWAGWGIGLTALKLNLQRRDRDDAETIAITPLEVQLQRGEHLSKV